MHHFEPESPSAWLTRFAPLIRAGGTVLDVACGAGRNARWLAARGWRVEAVDRDAAALAALQGTEERVTTRQADLEGAPWPYSGRKFEGIVVCRYLHRPLLPLLAENLADDGVLIYETFMAGQEKFGCPQNPDFLLRPNELLQNFWDTLRVVAFEQGIAPFPQPAAIQRICAVRGAINGLSPV